MKLTILVLTLFLLNTSIYGETFEPISATGTKLEATTQLVELEDGDSVILLHNTKILGDKNDSLGTIAIIPILLDGAEVLKHLDEAIESGTHEGMKITEVGIVYSDREFNLGELSDNDDFSGKIVKFGRIEVKSREGLKGANFQMVMLLQL